MPRGTHGMHNSPEHIAWRHMKDRCLNPRSQRYDRYGERGIRVCERWARSFVDFLADVGYRPSPHHSLDRIDNDGHYEPGNVRWAQRELQNNNKSSNRVITFRGESKTAMQWSRSTGIHNRTLLMRLDTGWSIEDALQTPVSKRVWTKSPGKRIDPQTRQAIYSDIKSGAVSAVIAEKYNISKSMACTLIRRVKELKDADAA